MPCWAGPSVEEPSRQTIATSAPSFPTGCKKSVAHPLGGAVDGEGSAIQSFHTWCGLASTAKRGEHLQQEDWSLQRLDASNRDSVDVVSVPPVLAQSVTINRTTVAVQIRSYR